LEKLIDEKKNWNCKNGSKQKSNASK